jgi:hypothetical protein
MRQESSTQEKAVTRRQFLKAGVCLAAYYAASPALAFAREQHPRQASINTDLSLDQYVDKYSESVRLSDNTKTILSENADHIRQRSREYGVPANLLAAIVAIETENSYVKPRSHRFQSIFNGKYLPALTDSTEGLAQTKLSTAAWIINNIYNEKGADYLKKDIPDIHDLTGILSKAETVRKAKGLGPVEKFMLASSLKKALIDSDSLSIEVAARYVRHLKERTKKIYHISEADFVSNPVALLLVLNAYRGGEQQLDNRHAMKQLSLDYLSLLRSGSSINQMFRDEKYSVVPDRRTRGFYQTK